MEQDNLSAFKGIFTAVLMSLAMIGVFVLLYHALG